RKGLYIGLGVGALVVAALIAIPFIAGGPPPSPPPAVAPPTAEQAAAPAPVDAPEIEWVTDFETAVSQANEDGTPVLLFLYSGQAASPDVTFMDDYTWSDPAVRNLVKDWICARIDVDTEPELQEQYEITKLPATLVTSYYFDEIDFRQEGTTTSQDFYNAMLAANMIPIEEPEMPGISALTIAMLVLLYVIGTFVPLVITLFLFGRMPDDNLATALVSIFLIGLFAPVLGRILLRETYEFGWFEYGAYYVMFLPTMIGLSVVFTALIGADINILLHLYGWLLTLSN
ncbi:MAG TPA: thioredoxin family protein, partial [Candidatus Hydrogenedentes bacterium]|nr:thioredoxin family protein [Candidatus Hydrogenedentota bacterium]